MPAVRLALLPIVLLLMGLTFEARGQFMQGRVEGLEGDMKRHVEFITADSLAGRAVGSKGELIVANYIYDQLSKAGVTLLTPRDGEDFYITGEIAEGVSKTDSLHSRNIIGVVEGYDPELRNEYVVIGAHIDHLGINRVTVNGEERVQIYPGADDNASGVAALIELAKEVANNRFTFRRSVIFAFFGAEEVGMAGSWYFLNRSFSATDKIVMMINLDMIGRSSGENRPQIFTGIKSSQLDIIVKNLSQRPLSLQPELSGTDYFPSDHRMFHEKGIPIALVTTGIHRDYHTPRDHRNMLDYTQMEQIAEFVFALAAQIANRDTRVDQEPEPVEEKTSDPDRYYTQSEVDKRATFLHGDETQFLNKWVYPYLKYPDSAVAAGESGIVVAEFIVGSDGKVSNVVIAKGVNDELDEEVKKVILASPKWKPAKLNGREVRIKTAVAVEFKLSKNASFKLKK